MSPVASIEGNHSYSFGQTAQLQCSVLGGPANSIQWSKDGQTLSNEVSATLTLTNITSLTGGMYTCSVNNTAGMDSTTVELTVQPYFTVQPVNSGGFNMGSVNLTCVAEAFPAPSYSWVKMGGAIRSNVLDVNTNTLTFEQLLVEDQGQYICTAESAGVRTDSEEATLTGMSSCAY